MLHFFPSYSAGFWRALARPPVAIDCLLLTALAWLSLDYSIPVHPPRPLRHTTIAYYADRASTLHLASLRHDTSHVELEIPDWSYPLRHDAQTKYASTNYQDRSNY